MHVSADLQRLAWAAPRGKKWVMMLDGKPGPAYDDVSFPAFSSDNQHFAYVARRGKKWLVVRDGQESALYENIGRPTFSPDSQRLAYAAQRGKKWVMMLDAEPLGPEYDGPWQPTFASNDRLIYPALIKKTGWVLVAGDKMGPGFATIAGLRVADGGTRHAYAGAKVKGGWTSKTLGTVVVDGEEVASGVGRAPKERPRGLGGLVAEAASVEGPFFEGGLFIVDYGGTHAIEVSPRGSGVSPPVFSPDGQRVVYALRGETREEVVVVNGEAGPAFDAVLTLPAFSRDGEHMAYLAVEKGNKGSIAEVVDGEVARRLPVGEWNFAEKATFTPDGARLAYIVGRGGWRFGLRATTRARRRVVVDGQQGKEYEADELLSLMFSPEGRHWACEVHKEEKNKSFVLVDGEEGKRYDEVFRGSLRFRDADTLVYVAREGSRVYRVTHTLPAEPAETGEQ